MTVRAAELLELKPDWDSYGGRAIDPEAVRRAEAFVKLMTETPAQFVPTSDGGVSVEWYTAENEACISFAPRLDGVFLVLGDTEDELTA